MEEREMYMKDIEEKVYRQALYKWGSEAQITMVFEEMAELQKELCKYLRTENEDIETKSRIAEEIADVEIMLEQMKLLFKIENAVEKHKKLKIQRLKNRLKR